jgi:polyisoprenoid-binding protein YceI
MKKIQFVLLFAFLIASVQGQTRYMTRTGYIQFYSHTAVEDIEAFNKQVSSILELETGRLVFQVPIKAFSFEKALMQEHFNENYMESDKFPKATFDGNITNPNDVEWGKTGEYPVRVKGKMTIHGVTQEVEEPGTFTVSDDGIQANAKFKLTIADYNIEIPSMVADKIAKEVEVTVKLDLNKAE